MRLINLRTKWQFLERYQQIKIMFTKKLREDYKFGNCVLQFSSEFLVSRQVSKNVEIKLYALNMSLLFVCGLPKYTRNRLRLNSSNIQVISG
jgi:hypothetical protein